MDRRLLRRLKYYIEEYEELCDEIAQMQDTWDNGNALNAASCDPSDVYMKAEEINDIEDEINKIIKEIEIVE